MLTGVLRNGRLISASGKILNSQVFSKKASDTRLSKVLNPGRFQIVNDWLKNGSNAAVGVERLITEPGSFKIKELKGISEFKGVPHNDPRSPYSQFIWLSLLEDTGNKTAGKAQILSALEEYHQPGGGYRNIQEAPGASTNATVAALSVRGQLAGYNKNQDTDYLKSLQQPTGGFCAATASPVPDLLSTATALFMLKCYDEVPRYDPGDFLEAHWLNSGGFCPTLIDDTSDVEYTFYGLLALGTIE
jgi:prenyltransferase beta subunit